MPTSPPQHRYPWVKPIEVRRTTARVYNLTKRENQKFYNSRHWRKAAKLHKKNNPLCIDCMAQGVVKAVEITDHIIPIKQGGELYCQSNLQSLCIACHNTKTAEEG
ncbi:MAG: HNH endonuclease [Ketobacter sp.]|nr:HNH endonuclease [Ketobacter sp.]